ncbi:N-acetylgalactosaminyltransferase 7 isoform X15 [Syngnathus scovelli]|uniref:N-acetylgalactosaminyltransferase 7 isoform X15 n=1 Tax=Syngnathus scovelli TaxID=161590 RepID=UPI0035C9525F
MLLGRYSKMRFKVGFFLRGLFVIVTFLVLAVLWSSLTKLSTGTHFGERVDALLPQGDPVYHFKPVIPWPHVEGIEVDLNSTILKHGWGNHVQTPKVHPNEKQAIQQQYATFRPNVHNYNAPILKKGVLGNFEPKKPEPLGFPGGLGEGAKPFVLGPEYKEAIHASIKEFGFNMVASDMISLDRTIRDIRHEECKYWHYDERLLTSSVVIVFHNEGWSTLMRTIHSVIKRTPRKYLAEIVMIDDFSNKVHLKERLEIYVKQWNGLVKLYRNEKREGLIQARSIGAKKATKGQVLIYLDAHCEVGINWYAPLVAPISEDRTVCTVPLIDAIHGEMFTIEPQGGGDEDGFARGAWDWSMLWKRVPLNDREKKMRKTRTEPYRQEHRCKSFKWFMEEIAYDIPLHYPLPAKNIEWGEIRGFETGYCIDSMGHTNGGNIETGPCHRMGGNQLFRINEANQLMQYDQCLTRGGDNSAVIITHCDQNQYTEWRYFKMVILCIVQLFSTRRCCMGEYCGRNLFCARATNASLQVGEGRVEGRADGILRGPLGTDLHRFTHVPTGGFLDPQSLSAQARRLHSYESVGGVLRSELLSSLTLTGIGSMCITSLKSDSAHNPHRHRSISKKWFQLSSIQDSNGLNCRTPFPIFRQMFRSLRLAPQSVHIKL